MNSVQAKQIKIVDYLHTLGISPKAAKGNDYWYHSPFRNERTTSFKVNNHINTWYDHGAGEGGNILDLVMRLHNIPTISEALAYLSGKTVSALPIDSFSLQQQKESSNENSSVIIRQIKPITNPVLTNYIANRKIDLELARQYCDEVHYQIRDRNYFAIGFKNDKGGYELSYQPEDRPSSVKAASSPKDITTFKTDSDTCLVFEGFWDFLSFLKLRNIPESKHNVIVLNSVANLSKAIDFIQSHNKIHTYLDNDDAGRKCLNEIQKLGITIDDRSEVYKGYKDLNDYLCGKKQVQKKPGLKL